MNIRRASFALFLSIACGYWSAAQAQDNQQWRGRGRERGQNQARDDNQDRGRGRGRERGQNQARDDNQDRGRERGRGRGFRPGNEANRPGERERGPGGFGSFGPGPLSPEQREQFYDRIVDRQLDRLQRNYELTDDQRELARQRLQALREEDQSTAEQRMARFNAIREQFGQLRQRGSAGEQVDPQQYRQLGEQMREIFRSSPLMNQERIVGEMDRILPPDQAARGRQRLQEERTRFDQQREERRQRFEQWRQQGGDPREFFRQQREQWRQQREQGGETGWPADPADGFDESDQDGRQSERERRREEWRRRRGERDSDRDGDDGRRRGRDRGRDRDRRESEPPPEDPLGPWERYVRDYIGRYRLDPSQQATAQSILRDLLNQRKLFEESHRNDIAIIEQIEDPARRQQQLESLHAPVVRMYEQLKAKLESIPTQAQREAAEGRRAATQPALATTRPALGAVTTRPAGEFRGGERRGGDRRFRSDNDSRRWRGRSRDRD